ncbi:MULTISPECIES: aspartate aminotransferase family protein [unclassified Solwaraspora]|uniref:aspartate aminotransferase family protein n=1 Tax=unclassified Solwaraspora TaxID=2627926 RepID=UPI00248CAB84|nr:MULTISPECIES: aspartate aminotransferase family protein [unclassified Solwaraspora]WBB95649.1 aspartate aminotransferase family protein [Solwaraspora sp. WMMA2059]WBC20447.1 aspartate aminotransferase family protein [Solwaraspora sp. WMMA2080]WJK37400.1 aspartate aminotransferase family protein [Solwaraspora sp. WMMA2065]
MTMVGPAVELPGAGAERRTLDLYRAHLSKGRATLAELFGSHMEVGSSGAWLETSDGERFLNCGGYGVFIMGARHPTVMNAVLEQLHRHPIATRILLEPTVAAAAEALISVAPKGLDRVHFALSGAEAVETGLKLARSHGKRRIVATHQGYHGKTMGALSASGKEVYRRPFEPLLPGVTRVPYGDTGAVERELAAHPGEVCFIVEPVQGEGGVIIPPSDYLRRVATLCQRYQGFLILDEVQTGMGRLGHWWGADLAGVVPDVLLVGKALGGGLLPVSAALASRNAFRPFDKDPYLHTGTFSGAPVLMAAVRGAIQAIKEGRLVTRAMEIGHRLLPEIRRIVTANCPELVVDVRGEGLLIGIELVEAGLAGELLIELFNHGIVGNHSMNGSSVVRFTPPAILSDSDVNFLLEALDGATRDLVDKRARMPEGGY